MWLDAIRERDARTGLVSAFPVLLVLALASPGVAGEWSLRLEPTLMDAFGHDQHVLNVYETSSGAVPATTAASAVRLETDSGIAARGGVRYAGETWAWGLDLTVFFTDQGTTDRTTAADGPVDGATYEVAGRSFSSAGPDEVLFYGVLEDTSLQTWTVDLYALRTVAEREAGGLQLQLGLRTADFDNDYRAVVGVQGIGGRRLDASSNYDRMMGPLVGVVGTWRCGRSTVEGSFALSVLLGSVELTSSARDFVGPLEAAFPVEGELPTTTWQETFRAVEDVAIPVTDLDLRWTYRLTGWLALGVGATSSTWWDVPVPPGVIPGPGGLSTLHESTIVFFGVSGIAQLTF